jgi:hypothetical protein
MAVLGMPPIRKRQQAERQCCSACFQRRNRVYASGTLILGGNSMLHRLILAIALAGFLGAVTLPSYTAAQTTTTEEKKDTKKKKAKAKEEKADAKEEPKKKTTEKKKAPTEKQLAARKKFSDCAHSWGDHKKATGEKTRKQYNAYMSKCLKKDG